jgi:hypothetical protein
MEVAKVQYNHVTTTASYLSANDRRVFFGLGNETKVKQIRILWPSGTEQVLTDPRCDQILKVEEKGRGQFLKPRGRRQAADDERRYSPFRKGGQARQPAGDVSRWMGP